MDSNKLFRIGLDTLLAAASWSLLGCSSSDGPPGGRAGRNDHGTAGASGGTSVASAEAAGSSTHLGGSSAGVGGAGSEGVGVGSGSGGSIAGKGSEPGAAGAGATASGGGSPGMGGKRMGSGGATPGDGGKGAGKGSTSTGGSTGGGTEGSTPGADCTVGPWPTSDPAAAGPFATVTENNVGPTAGVGADGGPPPQFTLFRPKDMTQGGLCHPVITWGNGTSANPSMYKVLLNNLASHGFVVIGSNSPNVAQGNPAPMIVGVTWVLEQNDDPSSVMYHRIDTTHIGATGHSQGAMATSQVAGDSHITTNVPIEGSQPQKNLHGPAMFFCGGQDTLVGCSGAESALKAVTTLPAMYAEYLSVDHGSWLTFTGNKPSAVEATVTAWMRVHLMDDTALRSWFYGADCKLCQDSGWQIEQKNMDP